MTPYEKSLTPTTERMAQDLKIRGRAKNTIDSYCYHVRKFEAFLGHSADTATPEDIRRFQLHIIEVKKLGFSSFNQAVCALRFLYQVTLPRPWELKMIPFGKRPKKLPVVLGASEVDRLLACVPNLKHRTFLLLLYAAGLRVSEAANLTIADIDGQRMQLRVTVAKGNKERLVPLSPRLLQALRDHWKRERPPKYLFTGKTIDQPINVNSMQKVCKAAAKESGLLKSITPHTLRHSFATGLLEAGVDILTIGRLLGHACFATTMIYLHCRQTHFDSAPSPIDWLPTRTLPGWKQPPSQD